MIEIKRILRWRSIGERACAYRYPRFLWVNERAQCLKVKNTSALEVKNFGLATPVSQDKKWFASVLRNYKPRDPLDGAPSPVSKIPHMCKDCYSSTRIMPRDEKRQVVHNSCVSRDSRWSQDLRSSSLHSARSSC